MTWPLGGSKGSARCCPLWLDVAVGIPQIPTGQPQKMCRRQDWTLVNTQLWACNPNIVKICCCDYISFNGRIKSKFCTCHDSSAVMPCAKLWPDLIFWIKIGARVILMIFELWDHELFLNGAQVSPNWDKEYKKWHDGNHQSLNCCWN